MKSLYKVVLIGVLSLTSLPAWAGHDNRGYDRAKVVRATPIFETVRYPVNEQVCWQEQGWQQRRHSAAPALLGAVIGGVVGHQFGGGNGKTALTVAGAAIGGGIGHKVAHDRQHRAPYPVAQNYCEMQQNWRYEERITGWDVAYKYRGNIYHTRMPEKPGKRIRVRVDVHPAPYYPGR